MTPAESLVELASLPHIMRLCLYFLLITSYTVYMLTLTSLGELIAGKRKSLGLSQAALAKRAAIGHSTLDALENNRAGELGFTKITRILSVLGMELKLQQESSRRPTLEDLMEEERDDQGLDRRH
jgi:DNA-binding XRE family transcriptional regulator